MNRYPLRKSVKGQNGERFCIYYDRVETLLEVEGYGMVMVYGTVVYLEGKERSKKKTECAIVLDISANKTEADQLIFLLADNGAFPIHVQEVIEDLI